MAAPIQSRLRMTAPWSSSFQGFYDTQCHCDVTGKDLVQHVEKAKLVRSTDLEMK